MDTETQKIYTYFRQLLDDNGIDYSGANYDVWKMINIEADKKDIKGSQVEVDFSAEGIKVKYYQKNQKIGEIPAKSIDGLIETVSNITKIKIQREYTDFKRLLDANRIDYSISDFGPWKTIFIDANKNDITSSQVEADFSAEGIKVRYYQENQEIGEISVKSIDELIETVSDITKIDIKETEKQTTLCAEVGRGARR